MTVTGWTKYCPFRSESKKAFFDSDLNGQYFVQPVTVTYFSPKNEDPRFYGWWGDMSFGAHLIKTIASRRQGRIEVRYHDPLLVSDFKKRKELATAAEKIIRSSHVFANSIENSQANH